MTTSIDMEHLKQDAVDIFHSGFTCSESVIYAIKKNFELDMPDEHRISMGTWRRRLYLRRSCRFNYVHWLLFRTDRTR